MILIDEYFRHYPARKKVAEFLLRHGINVRDGLLYLDDVEVPTSSVARAVGVSRKVVYLTAETIESSSALHLLFEKLKPELRVEDMAPTMGWETLEVEVSGFPGRVLSEILDRIIATGNEVISVTLRNLLGEKTYLSIVMENPLQGGTLNEISSVPGIKRILVKTPERDKMKLVCTFCEVRYCPRKLEGGGNGED